MPRPRQPLPIVLHDAPFSIAEARAAGLGRKRLLGTDLSRPYRGVRMPGIPALDCPTPAFAPSADDVALRLRVQALFTVLPAEAQLSHVTAARLWPLPLPARSPDEPVHISVSPPGSPPHRPGVVGHELTDPLAHQVSRDGLRFVDPATLFCQLATSLMLSDLVAVGDALVLTPVYDAEDSDRPWVPLHLLTKRVEQYRGRGKRAAARALSLVRCGSESRPETHVRLALVYAGLPEPELNIDLFSDEGRYLGRGDMLYRAKRVIVEYDGDHHRTSTEQYDADLQRIDRFVEAGWRVVRITGRAFYRNRAGEVARVARALSDTRWTP